MLQCLDVSKANGPDGISARMLECTAVSIAPSITRMFNLCIKMGKLPEGWKLSFIVLIPKLLTNQHWTSNYRPNSLLCVLSKVLEGHIHFLLIRHLEENCPLFDSQWGVRLGRLTVTAVISTDHEWLKYLESGKDICAMIFDYVQKSL